MTPMWGRARLCTLAGRARRGGFQVRKTASALAVVAMLAALGACSEADDEAGRTPSTPTTSSPSTSAPDDSPTTTAPDDDEPAEDEPAEPFDPFGGEESAECVGPTPVWALHAQAQPEPDDPESPDEECRPVEEPTLGTGDVQVTLRWSSAADLDLHVIEPDGTEIYYGDKGPTATGGRLDVDSNVGCEQEASVENVFWPQGQMPEGPYRVEVNGFSVDGCGSGDFTLTAEVQGEQVLDESGTVGEDEDVTFTFEA
jgi:hypothetical protein